MKKCFLAFILSVQLILSPVSYASLTPIKLNFKTQVPQTRRIYDAQKEIRPAYKKLSQVKQAYLKNSFQECSKLATESLSTHKLILPWLVLQASTCEIEAQKISKKVNISKVKSLSQQILNRKDWLLSGPYSTSLRSTAVELQLLIVEWEVKNRPQIALSVLGPLLDLEDWMTAQQKAKTYQVAGELSFLQQNLIDAKAYILKSLDEVENPKLKEKLVSIETALLRDSPESVGSFSVPSVLLASELGMEEKKIVERMTLALQSGDLFSAAKDGMELIENYPGSVQADWAFDRIIDAFLSISTQDNEKYRALKYDFINIMKEADVQRLLGWGKKIYKAGFYKDALVLLKEAYSKSSGVLFNIEVLDYLARSYLNTTEFSKAEEIFTELTKKYSGTKESIDAYFYLGLISFLDKKFSKAQGHLEKILSQTQYADQELPARYWLWRASQKLDAQRAQQEAQFLITKFPFSYYGLIAISEQNKGVVDFTSLNKPIKSKYELWLSPYELESWKRLQVLLESGWYEEASQELLSLPVPSTPEGAANLARYFAAAMDYPRAIKMINKAWDEKSELRAYSLIQVAFPKEFYKIIETQSVAQKVNPLLILSLMRQESSFNPRAVSSSGALGLMQLIPPTAKDVAQTLKIKDFEIPKSLFNPENNIRMGTYYISKMIQDFGNNIPFALAAYNAGPTKVKRWMAASNVKPQSTSSPDYEVWLDLLPWSETRFYVKAILRNYLIYQLLDLKPIQVKDPVWAQ